MPSACFSSRAPGLALQAEAGAEAGAGAGAGAGAEAGAGAGAGAPLSLDSALQERLMQETASLHSQLELLERRKNEEMQNLKTSLIAEQQVGLGHGRSSLGQAGNVPNHRAFFVAEVTNRQSYSRRSSAHINTHAQTLLLVTY